MPLFGPFLSPKSAAKAKPPPKHKPAKQPKPPKNTLPGLNCPLVIPAQLERVRKAQEAKRKAEEEAQKKKPLRVMNPDLPRNDTFETVDTFRTRTPSPPPVPDLPILATFCNHAHLSEPEETVLIPIVNNSGRVECEGCGKVSENGILGGVFYMCRCCVGFWCEKERCLGKVKGRGHVHKRF